MTDREPSAILTDEQIAELGAEVFHEPVSRGDAIGLMLQAAFRLGMLRAAQRAAEHCENYARDNPDEATTALEIALDIEEYCMNGDPDA